MNLFRPGWCPCWLKLVSVLLVLFLNTTVLAVPDGDVDGDCKVTAADALLVLRAVVGFDPNTARMQIHGDVAPLGPGGVPSPDGIISLADALIILKKSIGLVAWDSPPQLITSQPQTTAQSDLPYQYQVTLSPPRNALTRFSLDQGPAGMSIDSASGLLSWTPQAGQLGSNPVTIKVGDTPCATVHQSYVVQVSAGTAGNLAPVANAGPNQTITLAAGQTAASVTLNGTASSDPDGSIASYAWSGVSGAPQPAPASGAMPSVTLGTGTYTFALVVTDNKGSASGPSQVTITVNPAGNLAPLANAGPNQTVTLASGQTTASVTLNGTASSDPDGTIASYAWSGVNGAPQPAPANGATASVTLGTGTYTFALVVTDDKGTASSSSPVTVTVNPAGNLAPNANAGANQVVTLASGQTTASVTLNGTASSDPDGSVASYAWNGVNGAPQPAPANGATSTAILGAGTYTFALVVTDNKGTASSASQVTVTVNPAGNQAPTADAGANQTITLPAGQSSASVTLNGTASSDPDGTVASYAWSGVNGAPQPAPADGATPSVTLGTGIYTFALIVTDNNGTASSASQVTVTVNAGNRAPTANAGPNQTITLAAGQSTASVTLNGTASSDPDGTIASYAWSGLNGAPQPAPANGAMPTVTLATGIHTFSLMVTDNNGAASDAQVTITVNPAGNLAPFADAGPNQTVTLPAGQNTASVTLNGTASSDPDGGIASYAWSGMNGAPQPAPASAAMPSVTLGTGSYTFALVVTDNKGTASSASQVTVTVNPAGNLAPTANAGPSQTVTLATGQTTASVTLDGTASSDADGSIASYAWSGLSGAPQPAPASAATPSVTLGAGTYTFALVVTDNLGAASSASQVTVTVNPAGNLAPTANAGPNQSITLAAGQSTASVNLNGTASSDADGSIASYAWSGVGGAPQPAPAGAATPSVTLATGTYTFALVVTDNKGAASSASQVTVTVNPAGNLAPSANAGSNQTITLAAGQTTASVTLNGTASSDPDGTIASYAWSGVSPGAPQPAPATGAAPTVTLAAGTYTFALVVTDNKGTASSASQVTITVNPAGYLAPKILTASLPAPKIDSPYTFTLAVSNPGGYNLAFALGSGIPAGATIDASTGTISWHPTVAEIGKSYRFDATMSDDKGGKDTRGYLLAVTDTIPPVVSLNAPTNAIPGSSFKVTAVASDNVGVTLVRIAVDGKTMDYASPPFEYKVAIGQVAAIGSSVQVTATAWDAAANSATATTAIAVVGTPTADPPVVALNAPAKVASGSNITLSAAAFSKQGVSRLMFKAGTDAVGSTVPPTVTTSYPVPSTLVAGDTINFSVTATDFSGNSATAQIQSTVAELPDTTPPAIALDVPLTLTADSKLPVNLTVTDDGGVASVELSLAHQLVATYAGPLNQVIEVPLPPGVDPGMDLIVEVKATDFSGNLATASKTTRLLAPESKEGLVTGSVFDDTTGLPLQGAQVTFSRNGADPLGATTDEKGRYTLVASEGIGDVAVTGPGYTRADLPAVTFVRNIGQRIADARLTPVAGTGTPVAAVPGGTVSASFTAAGAGLATALAEAGVTAVSGQLSVAFAPGALGADQNLTVTQVSAQGVQGRLPAGWSPLAAFTLLPAGVPLGTPADVTVPNLLGGAVPATVLIAYWDQTGGVWKSLGTAATAADRSTLTAKIPATGHFAFLVPDAAAVLPAALPAAGQPLPAVAQPAFPQDLQSLVTPDPKVIFYKPGVKSQVGTRVAGNAPLASGSVVWADVAGDYSLYSGDRIIAEPYDQEIVLYSFGLSGGVLLADYPVSPEPSLAKLVLEKGTITVSAAVPPADSGLITVIGPAGGTLNSTGGETLAIPTGAVSRFVPASIKQFSLAGSGLDIPAGFRLVGGAVFSATGAGLGKPAALSVAPPAGFTEGGDLILVRAVKVGGANRFAVIGSGAVEGGRIVSSRVVPGTTQRLFPGITEEGSLLFLQATQQLGYAGGTVTGVDSAPFRGAVVSGDTLPLLALSGSSGGYATAIAAGPFTLTALDPEKLNRAALLGSVAARQFFPADITLKIELPAVASVTPANGAVDVALAAPLRIRFTKPLDPATVSAAAVTLTSAAGPVNGILSLSGDALEATLRPVQPLEPKTLYTVAVAASVRDLAGYAMAQAFSSGFTTLDTNPPPAPPAGSVTASIPGTENTTTVTATQGTAGLHDTVFVVNLTTGARNQVQVDPNGGVSATIAATAKDRLQIEITNPAGITTTVTLPRFRQLNSDGSISEFVGPEGGTVLGPKGIAVDVPAGAFTSGTVIKLSPIDEASFPVQLSSGDKVNFAYSGGISLDLGGQVPAIYLNMSLPAAPTDSVDDRWVVTQVINVNGQNVLASVDTAKVINGRIATASPPCPGITSGGRFGVLRSVQGIGVAYGSLGYQMPAGSAIDVSSAGAMLPYGVDFGGSFSFCVPVFSTDVTVAYNTVKVVVNGVNLDVKEIVIHNTTADTYSRFAREALNYTFEIDGSASDLFRVLVTDLGGNESEVHGFTIFAADSGKIGIQVPIGAFNLRNTTQVALENVTNAAVASVTYLQNQVEVVVPVDGGMSDSFDNVQISALTGSQPLLYGLRPSKAGPKNLVVTVNPGTISPTRLGGASSLQGIRILDNSNLVALPQDVLLATLVNGGFEFNFNGLLTDDYALELTYDDIVLSQPFGKFTIRLKDPKGAVIKTITLPSPFRNAKTNVGTLSDVTTKPPVMTQVPLDLLRNFRPGTDNLTFTFSEPVKDPATLASNIDIRDSNGTRIAIDAKYWVETVPVTGDQYRVTVIFRTALTLGESYSVTLSGIRDLGNNLFQYTDGSGNTGANVTMTLKTVSPSLVKTIPLNLLGMDVPVKDIGLISNASGSTTLAAISDTPSGNPLWRIMTFDIPTDPVKASMVGSGYGGGFKQRVQMIEAVDMKVAGTVPGCDTNISGDATAGYRFKGNLAVTTSSAPVMETWISIYDITDPTKVCQLGGKLLTADPLALSSYSSPGTYHTSANLRGITYVKDSEGYKALVAAGEFAIMSVNLGDNIPEPIPGHRVKEGVFQGNYPEIYTVGDNLVVYNKDAEQLELLDMNFAQISALPFSAAGPATIFKYSGTVQLDLNNSGTTTAMDLVFAYRPNSPTLAIIDVANRMGPQLVASVNLPEAITAVDFDRNNRKIIATSARTVYVLDLKSLNPAASLPVMWKYSYTDRNILCVKVDGTRGLFYVGTSKSLEVFDLVNGPNLFGVAKYVRFNPKNGVGLDFANPVTLKVRGALVELRDAGGAVIATTKTDPDGYYSFYAPYNQPLKLFLKAVFSDRSDFAPRLKVVDDAAVPAIYVAPTGGKNVTVTSKGTRRDILADAIWDPVAQSYTVRDAAPFAILDTIYTIESKIRMVDRGVVFPDLTVQWSPAIVNSTAYYDDIKTFKVNGDIMNDSDEYDTIIIGHEWFHYWQEHFSRADSPGGTHASGEKSDHRLAFDEGFATAFSAIFTNDPINNPTYQSWVYIDTGAGGVAGCGATCQDIKAGSPANKGFYNERAITELIWALQEPSGTVKLPFGNIYSSIKNQLSVKPFVSIYSYMYDLAHDFIIPGAPKYASYGAPILTLFDAKEIRLRPAEADDYEPFDPRLYNPIDLDRAAAKTVATYTQNIGNAILGCLHPSGVDNLTTCVDNYSPGAKRVIGGTTYGWDYDGQRGNMLLEKVLFKFKVTAAQKGAYTFAARAVSAPPAGASDPSWKVQMKMLCNGVEVSGKKGFLPQEYSFTEYVPEGDCSAEVTTRIWYHNEVDVTDGNNKSVFLYAPAQITLTMTPR